MADYDFEMIRDFLNQLVLEWMRMLSVNGGEEMDAEDRADLELLRQKYTGGRRLMPEYVIDFEGVSDADADAIKGAGIRKFLEGEVADIQRDARDLLLSVDKAEAMRENPSAHVVIPGALLLSAIDRNVD